LYQVRVADLQAYLLGKGWEAVPPDRPNVLVFREPQAAAEGPLYQCVPDNEQRRDYLARVYELLAALADVEGRYAGDVLSDILHLAGRDAPNGAPHSSPRPAEVRGK
jgi:hypothetical protein